MGQRNWIGGMLGWLITDAFLKNIISGAEGAASGGKFIKDCFDSCDADIKAAFWKKALLIVGTGILLTLIFA